jgi:hypothetical protein
MENIVYNEIDNDDDGEMNYMKFVVKDRDTQKQLENYLQEISNKYFDQVDEEDLDYVFNVSVFQDIEEFITTFSVPFDDEINYEIIESIEEKFGDSVKNVPYYYAKGGFLGGIFGGGRTYKKGLAYKLDRAKHNKSEDWEVPLKNRKRYANGGGVGDKKPKFKIGDEVVALPSKFRFVKKIVGSYDGGEHFGTMYSLESSPNTYYTENQLEFPNEENTKYQERGRSLEYYQGVPIYAKGGGVEDYYGSMTDESVVMQNCSNGEIHCDILEEIIGSKPEYPYQEVGSIRLQKCYLRPYYKICK